MDSRHNAELELHNLSIASAFKERRPGGPQARTVRTVCVLTGRCAGRLEHMEQGY